ncbi:MAG: helicase RepA family protein [Pseudomonadales bacterium]
MSEDISGFMDDEGDLDAWIAAKEQPPSVVEEVVAPAEPRRFRLHHVSELELTPPKWCIRNLMEADCLAMVFADPGAGKSFLAIDVACCVATGTDFHGHAVAAGPVVYIAGEGRNGLSRRFKAWEIRHNVELLASPLYVSGGPAALCHAGSANDVAAAVDAIATEHGSPALVVIDTVARNFGPGDENSTQDMGAFVQAADLIRAKHEATVLFVHHTGHGDKSRGRGAMALHGALDAEYRMDKDETGVVRLESTKMKDGPMPEPMAFRIRTVELGITDDEGEPVTAAILDSTSYEPPPKAGKAGRGKWQTVAIEVLDTLEQDSNRVDVEHWRQECLSADMPRQRFHEVQKALIDQNLITVEFGFVRSGLSVRPVL